MADFRIGDYDYTIIDSENRYVAAKAWDSTKVTYGTLNSTVEYDGVTYTLTSMERCFSRCYHFNQSIEIPNTVINMEECFFRCEDFNQSIEIPNTVINMNRCFHSCELLNSPVTFEENSQVEDMASCFAYCEQFNQPIEIPNSVINMNSCFEGCKELNSPITFEENSQVEDMTECFNFCRTFNQFFIIPSTVKKMNNCFMTCFQFNNSILCLNKPTEYSNIFVDGTVGETNFNLIIIGEDNYSVWENIANEESYVHIPDVFKFEYGDYRYINDTYEIRVKAIDRKKTEYGEIIKTYINNKKVTDMGFCFYNCIYFNQPIEIPDSVTSMSYCFSDCTSFNQSIKIPDSVIYMNGCFNNCTSFNQFIEIPYSVSDMRTCFFNCTSLGADIKVRKIIQINEHAFLNTRKDIYIINEAESSSKEEVAEAWREIANEYPNVHYELDDHPSPLLELDVKRANGKSEPSTSGIYVLVNLQYTFSNSFIPYGKPAPSLDSESLVLDNTRIISLTEERSYLIDDIDDNQHVFIYTVSDGYKTSTITRILSRVMALLDFQGDSGKDYVDAPGMGIAIGTIATRNGLAIQFPTTIGDELLPATKKTEVYALTTDTEFNPEKEYYEKDGDNYVLTEDTEFIDGKEYYENREAIDLDNYQLVVGRYNIKDEDKAFIIGNGKVEDEEIIRSNALTVDWDGNTEMQGRAITADMTTEEITIFINELRGN